jgi:hypothetical protein
VSKSLKPRVAKGKNRDKEELRLVYARYSISNGTTALFRLRLQLRQHLQTKAKHLLMGALSRRHFLEMKKKTVTLIPRRIIIMSQNFRSVNSTDEPNIPLTIPIQKELMQVIIYIVLHLTKQFIKKPSQLYNKGFSFAHSIKDMHHSNVSDVIPMK